MFQEYIFFNKTALYLINSVMADDDMPHGWIDGWTWNDDADHAAWNQAIDFPTPDNFGTFSNSMTQFAVDASGNTVFPQPDSITVDAQFGSRSENTNDDVTQLSEQGVTPWWENPDEPDGFLADSDLFLSHWPAER